MAVVTGASRGGIGTAIAVRLAAEGARVAVAARTREGLEEAGAQIESVGSTGAVFVVDLSDPDGARNTLIADVEAALGPVDILVNNSAMGGYKAFEKWSQSELRTMLEVNALGPWLLAQHALPAMRAHGRGAILNISSAAAELPVGPPFSTAAPARSGSAYGSTKAMLNRWTASLAAETHGEGIVVNALSPQGAAATPALVGNEWFPKVYFEPLDTMAEAALALCTGPDTLTGRIAYSLALLVELDRPVFDVTGSALLDDWQPGDIPAKIAAQLAERAKAMPAVS